jgi:hypothetical protein
MIAADVYDTLTVIDGPEDGTAFPIARARFHIGRDAAHVVAVRLDDSVTDNHAFAQATSEGYRIRAVASGDVTVNGAPAGIVRSRMLRQGDILKIGHTSLVLECAPEGLAQRSKGLALESDFVWMLRRGARGIACGAERAKGLGRALGGFALRHWQLSAFAAGVVVYYGISGAPETTSRIFYRFIAAALGLF